MLLWNTQTLLIGFIYGIVLMLGYYFFLVDVIIHDIQQEDVDDPSVNSRQFEVLFKYGTSLTIPIMSTLVLGPLFGRIFEWFLQQETMFGLSAVIIYIIIILLFSLFLDIAVFVTKTPFPWEKIIGNTWTFLVFGLLIPLILN